MLAGINSLAIQYPVRCTDLASLVSNSLIGWGFWRDQNCSLRTENCLINVCFPILLKRKPIMWAAAFWMLLMPKWSFILQSKMKPAFNIRLKSIVMQQKGWPLTQARKLIYIIKCGEIALKNANTLFFLSEGNQKRIKYVVIRSTPRRKSSKESSQYILKLSFKLDEKVKPTDGKCMFHQGARGKTCLHYLV